VYLWQRHQDAPLSMGYDAAGMPDTEVSVLRIAIDGRARKFVQSELARIAKVACPHCGAPAPGHEHQTA